MAAQIEITASGGHSYSVTLQDGGRTTHHQVEVPSTLMEDLGLDPSDEERLVRASFEFLLEREPPTSILRQFELDVIGRYFPDYVATLRDRLAY